MKYNNFNQIFLNTLDSRALEPLLVFLHLDHINANISEKSLSILLAKASFAFLLTSMFSYWFQMSFKSEILMKFAPTRRYFSQYLPLQRIKDLSLLRVPHRGKYAKQGRVQRILAERGGEKATTSMPSTLRRASGVQHFATTSEQSTAKQTSVLTTSSISVHKSSTPSGYRNPSCYANPYSSGKQEALGPTPFRVLAKRERVPYVWGGKEPHKVGDLIIDRKNFLEKVPLISMWSANITLALLLSIRWIESGHFPLSNLYESLIFLSWSLTVIHLFLENLFHKREQILCNVRQEILGTNLTLGAITSPIALFTNAFATFSLPQEMQKVTVLVPALKSNWLIMHVSVMIISYAALLSGSLLAMAFLVFKFMHEYLYPLPPHAPLYGLAQQLDNKIHSIRYTFINYVSSLTQLINRGSNAYVTQRRSKKRFDTDVWSEEKGKLLFMGTRNKEGFLTCEIEEGSDAHGLTSNGVSNPTPFRVKVAERQTLRDMRGGVQRFATTSMRERGNNIFSGQRNVEDPIPLQVRRFATPTESYGVNNNRFFTLQSQQQLDLTQVLDNLSYRCISLGFALLTIGILSGAVWANEAWGSYWSWDPKETWAFITWLVFALYLHTRLSKGWVGKESAFVASFGFLVIWFCYLGVNLFGKGLHSYGWFQQ